MRAWIVLAALLLGAPCAYAGGQQVVTIPPQSEYDASHSYYIGLLELALEKTEGAFGAAEVLFARRMEQGRAFHELAAGRLDVYWAGTSVERERDFRAVRIPLVKGLLGFRVPVIRRESLPAFEAIETIEDLRAYTVCQGMHWPDADILEAAGIHVERGAVYENLFRMLQSGRCDCFTRGIHEGVVEMAARPEAYPDLMLFKGLILYYPFPMYFFFNPAAEALAQRVERGLEQAIADGSFDAYMRRHPTTAHLFPFERWMGVRTVVLGNPYLPRDTPVDDPRYWLPPPQGRGALPSGAGP